MGVGKEAIYELETLARQQTRIYPDACDYGILHTPARAARIRAALAELKELEGLRVERWYSGLCCHTRIALEMDGGRVQGCLIRVALHSPAKGPRFFSIDITRGNWAPGSNV